MNKLTKYGVSALCGSLAAISTANAGDLSVTGGADMSWISLDDETTGNPIGIGSNLTFTGSGELDNGVGVAYKQTVTDAMAFNDSELVFTGVPMMGDATVAITSTGSPLSAIDDVTPIAFEEANAAVGSIDDVNGMDGTYGIRYTLADVMGSGFKLDAMYTPKHGTGDATAEKGVSGAGADQNEEGYEVTLTGSVPMVDGLSVGVGYAQLAKSQNETTTSSDEDQDEGTAYIKYATGGLTLGYQKGVVAADGANETRYTNDYIGISYAISDNLSISYNEIESNKKNDSTDLIQEMDSISLSYTMGGMTIGILDSEAENASYTSARKQSARSIQMSVAF